MKYFIFSSSIFAGILPFFYLISKLINNSYGAEPTKAILHFLGDWSIYFLLIILVGIWVLRLIKISFQYSALIFKIFGIYSLLYALGHILFYILIEQNWDLLNTFNEIRLRIYLLLGALSFLCLLILSVFSLFFRNLFSRFSPLVYMASLLGSIHYLLGQKIPVVFSYIIFFVFLALVCMKLLSKNKDK